MADYKTTQIDIGSELSFTKLPAQVDIGDWSYFLAKTKKGSLPVAFDGVPARHG